MYCITQRVCRNGIGVYVCTCGTMGVGWGKIAILIQQHEGKISFWYILFTNQVIDNFYLHI